jgi:hypothetical protein
VTWKKSRLAIGEIERAGMTRERAQHVIDVDIAFLAAHPTKKSVPMSHEKKQERSKFKEAMRQRIREIGASRDLSDDEIRLVLGLKHHRVAEFVDKHGINFEWLYEGNGGPFAADPMRGPREADQQAIRATIREILQERDQ